MERGRGQGAGEKEESHLLHFIQNIGSGEVY